LTRAAKLPKEHHTPLRITEKTRTAGHANRKNRAAAQRTVTDIHRTQEVVMLLGHPVLFKSLCYVDGRWIHSASAASVAVHNPADQQVDRKSVV